MYVRICMLMFSLVCLQGTEQHVYQLTEQGEQLVRKCTATDAHNVCETQEDEPAATILYKEVFPSIGTGRSRMQKRHLVDYVV